MYNILVQILCPMLHIHHVDVYFYVACKWCHWWHEYVASGDIQGGDQADHIHHQQMVSKKIPIIKSRGTYIRWSPEERLEIAKACSQMGLAKASREMSKRLNRKLSKSTAQNIYKQYLKMLGERQQSSEFAGAKWGPLPQGTSDSEQSHMTRYSTINWSHALTLPRPILFPTRF